MIPDPTVVDERLRQLERRVDLQDSARHDLRNDLTQAHRDQAVMQSETKNLRDDVEKLDKKLDAQSEKQDERWASINRSLWAGAGTFATLGLGVAALILKGG